MNRREFIVLMLGGAAIGFSTVSRVGGQAKTITPDLGALADGNGWLVNPHVICQLAPEGAFVGSRGRGDGLRAGDRARQRHHRVRRRGKDVAQ